MYICIYIYMYLTIYSYTGTLIIVLQPHLYIFWTSFNGFPEKTANTEASELSRSRVGTGRLPNRLGQGATPLGWHNCPWNHGGYTTWLENGGYLCHLVGKCCFMLFFFFGLLEGFSLRFTASWVDNVKDSECEMKTQLILELKKGRSCPSI